MAQKDVTKTNTFDKLISDHTGALPSISNTNYNEVDEPDEVENVEEAINASIKDKEQATNDAISLANHYQRVKESKLKMLTGMIEPASKIFKYMKAREANVDIYENYEKNYKKKGKIKEEQYWKPAPDQDPNSPSGVYKPSDGPPVTLKTSTVDTETGIEKTEDQLIEDQLALETKLLERLKDNLLAKDFNDLSLDEQQVYLNDDQETITNKNANQATIEIKENFDTQIVAELGVQKILCVEGMGCMDTPMSYFEATEPGRSSQDAAWIPYLYKDAIHDFNAANDDLIQAIGKKRYIQRVFPNLMETGDQIRGKVLSSAINQKLENRKNDRYVSTYNEWEASNFDTALLWGDQPGSFININEVGLDGSKDNVAAWNDLGDMLIHWHKKGYINKEDLEALINEAEIPVRGSKGKTATMETLNKTTKAVRSRIAGYLSEEKSDAEIAQEQLTDKVDGLVSNVRKRWAKRYKEEGVLPTTEELISEINKISDAVSGQVSYTSDLFNPLKQFDSQTKRERTRDIITLEGQMSRNEAVSWELIEKLPQAERQKYINYGNRKGFNGFTSDEQTKIDENIYLLFEEIASLPKASLKNDYRYQSYHSQAEKIFKSEYQIHFDSAPADLRDRGKHKERKRYAMEKAFAAVQEEITKVNAGEKNRIQSKTVAEYDKETANLDMKESAKIVNYINKNPQLALTVNAYHGPAEKEALIQFEKWKNGDAPFPTYFSNYSRLYKGTYTNAAGEVRNKDSLWFANQRYKATRNIDTDLGENSETSNVPGVTEYAATNDPSKAAAVINANGIDAVISDFENPDADNGFDTITGAEYPWGTKAEDKWVLPEGLTVSTATIGELIHASNRNKGNLRYGMYDIPASVLKQMLMDGVINKDAVFDEDTQKLILTRRILTKANNANSLKNLDSTFRRLNWLEPEEVEEFKTLLESITGDERFSEDPYYALTILNPSAAKAVLNMSISGEVGSEESIITNLDTLEISDNTEKEIEYGLPLDTKITISGWLKSGVTIRYANKTDELEKRQLGDTKPGPLGTTLVFSVISGSNTSKYLGWKTQW